MNRRLSATILLLLPLACGELLGISDVPVPVDDGGSPVVDGGSADTAVPPFDATGCDACGPDIVPPGWTPIVYTTTKTSCPADFTGLSLVQTDPVIQVDAGACGCTANAQVTPSCTTGTVSLYLGCGGAPVTIPIVDGGCAALSSPINLQSTESAPVLSPTGGSCTPVATSDTSKLSSVTAATCVPTTCPDALCSAGAAPAGYTACIEHDGDLDCPSTGPFSTKHPAADTFTLDCSMACTTCVASATCANAVLTLWADMGCIDFVTAVSANGGCHGSAPAPVSGATYAAATQNVAFTADGPKTAIAKPVNPKTICCR